MVTAIILAAGHSTRMGSPKALLRDREGRPFVARIARTLVTGGCGSVTVVTGAAHDAIRDAVEADAPPGDVRLVRNPAPDRGQLSSIWAGLDDAVRPGVDAVLLALVDAPFFAVATVCALIEAYRVTGAPIIRPARGIVHGHPVLFDRGIVAALRAADPAVGAKAVVRAKGDRLLNLPVDDDGAFLDVDTPDDYARAVPHAEEG